jgi:hypothetical protein
MKQLPDKFQFRVDTHPGYTHTATRNSHWDYEVSWARGWANVVGFVPIVVFVENEVLVLIDKKSWIFVEDKPKQKGANLPDEFYFLNSQDYTFKAKRDLRTKYFNFESIDSPYSSKGAFSESEAQECLKCGLWKILDKKHLTVEQQRTLNEFKDQVAQLDSSIRIAEQNIEHQNRMIANYRQRQDDLRDKIKELEGV